MWANTKMWLKNHDYAWGYKLKVVLPIFLCLLISGIAGEVVVQLTMKDGQTVDIIPGFISFVYQLHTGSHASNELSLGGTIAIAAVITLVTGIVLVFLNDKMWLIAIVFIFTGAFLNLINRAWTPETFNGWDTGDGKGGVLNILHFEFYPFDKWFGYFSSGDAQVSVGVVLLVVFLIVELISFALNPHKKDIEPMDDINDDSSSIEEIKSVKSSEPKTYTDKELKAQAKLEKKMRKHEHKSN